MELTVAVYTLTRGLPVDERFSLVSQMRRCAVSVPSNIAEGEGRGTDGEIVRFCQIAHGSLRELETQIEICVRLGYLEVGEVESTCQLTTDVGRLLNGLIRSKRHP